MLEDFLVELVYQDLQGRMALQDHLAREVLLVNLDKKDQLVLLVLLGLLELAESLDPLALLENPASQDNLERVVDLANKEKKDPQVQSEHQENLAELGHLVCQDFPEIEDFQGFQ